MSGRLSPNADQRAVIAALRELATRVDSIANGKFRITGDLDFGGRRIRNLGAPVDHNDAAIKGQIPGEDFAPIGAAYVVAGSLDQDLTSERLLAASTGITITDNGAGSTVTVEVDSTLLGASFVTLATNSILPNERVLTGSASILVTDGGAGTTATLSVIAAGTTAGTVTVADAAGDTTTFPVLAGSATGDLPMLTDAGLTYNATTNVLTAGGYNTPTGGKYRLDSGESNETSIARSGTLGATTVTMLVNSGGASAASYNWDPVEFFATGAENLGTTGSRWGTAFLTDLTITNPVTVANGGSGRATGTTAYSLVATGTTATGAQQTLANGATTEILVGGGAGALPAWTTAQGSGAPVRAISPTGTGTWALPIVTATSLNATLSGTQLALATDEVAMFTSRAGAGNEAIVGLNSGASAAARIRQYYNGTAGGYLAFYPPALTGGFVLTGPAGTEYISGADASDVTVHGASFWLLQKVGKYDNIATEGHGVPAIYKENISATKTANFTAASLTPPATAGRYIASAVLTTTSATNTGTLQVTIDYKDSQGTTHTADVLPIATGVGGTFATTTGVVASSKEYHTAPFHFTIDNSATDIVLKVVITGTVSYTVAPVIEQLG